MVLVWQSRNLNMSKDSIGNPGLFDPFDREILKNLTAGKPRGIKIEQWVQERPLLILFQSERRAQALLAGLLAKRADWLKGMLWLWIP